MLAAKNWKKPSPADKNMASATMSAGRKRFVLFLLVSMIGGWIAILFWESSRPPAEVIGKVQGLDKLAHFVAFGMLGLLVCALSFHIRTKVAIPLFSMPLLLVSLVGIIEESYQSFVPGRTASLPDLVADVCGAIAAILLANRIALISRSYGRFRNS